MLLQELSEAMCIKYLGQCYLSNLDNISNEEVIYKERSRFRKYN